MRTGRQQVDEVYVVRRGWPTVTYAGFDAVYYGSRTQEKWNTRREERNWPVISR